MQDAFGKGELSMEDSQVEANKEKALKGWIGDPPPQREPLPAAHISKWRRMNAKKQA